MAYYHCLLRPGFDLNYGLTALRAGLDGIEIRAHRSYLTEEAYEKYLQDVKTLIAHGARVSIHAPIVDIHLGSMNRDMRRFSMEQVCEAAELAGELGASVVVVHPGMGVVTMPAGEWSADSFEQYYRGRKAILDEVRGNVIDSVQQIADRFPEVTLALENLVYPHELYRFPEEMTTLVEQVDRPNVGLNLDIGHASTVGWAPLPFYEAVKEHVVHVHMHDNHGARDEHLPLGEGSIDYRPFLEALSKDGYDGTITFEFALPDGAGFARYIR